MELSKPHSWLLDFFFSERLGGSWGVLGIQCIHSANDGQSLGDMLNLALFASLQTSLSGAVPNQKRSGDHTGTQALFQTSILHRLM